MVWCAQERADGPVHDPPAVERPTAQAVRVVGSRLAQTARPRQRRCAAYARYMVGLLREHPTVEDCRVHSRGSHPLLACACLTMARSAQGSGLDLRIAIAP